MVPIIVLVFSIFLVIAPIVDNPKLEYAYSIAFMLFGASLYVPFVKYKLRLPFIGEIVIETLIKENKGDRIIFHFRLSDPLPPAPHEDCPSLRYARLLVLC